MGNICVASIRHLIHEGTEDNCWPLPPWTDASHLRDNRPLEDRKKLAAANLRLMAIIFLVAFRHLALIKFTHAE